MSAVSERILAQLSIVERERRQRASTPGLDANVEDLKAFQQRRFARTYADLLEQSRYRAACSFFLEELYGPRDYTRRDNQFTKVVPTLARLFPSEIVQTVDRLAELHALSEVFDTAMALQLPAGPVSAPHYVRAWQAVGREADRRRQIELTLSVAERLDQLTGKPLLRRSLHLMRGPARSAGLGELQQFLECGFDAFRAMKGASEFVAILRQRETSLGRALFRADPSDGGGSFAGPVRDLG
jgi:hypothetical protein